MHDGIHRILSITTGLIVALSSVVLLGGSAHAAGQRTSITLSPTDKHYTVDPGETISDNIMVLNSGDTSFGFTTYAAPYSVADKTYDPNYDDLNAPRADAYKWVSFSQGTHDLVAGKNVTIPFTLTVSKDASPGGHYGIIFAETKPTENQTGFVLEKRRVGMIVYVTVKGESRVSGSVSSVSIPLFQPNAPMTASATVTNAGNVDFPADITYTVSDLLNNEKYKFTDQRYIMPNSNRAIDLSWNESPWVGIYKAKVAISALGKTTTRETLVIVAPVWLIFLALLGVILAAVGIVRRKKTAPRQMRRHR